MSMAFCHVRVVDAGPAGNGAPRSACAGHILDRGEAASRQHSNGLPVESKRRMWSTACLDLYLSQNKGTNAEAATRMKHASERHGNAKATRTKVWLTKNRRGRRKRHDNSKVALRQAHLWTSAPTLHPNFLEHHSPRNC